MSGRRPPIKGYFQRCADRGHHFIASGVRDEAPLEEELALQADKLIGDASDGHLCPWGDWMAARARLTVAGRRCPVQQTRSQSEFFVTLSIRSRLAGSSPPREPSFADLHAISRRLWPSSSGRAAPSGASAIKLLRCAHLDIASTSAASIARN